MKRSRKKDKANAEADELIADTAEEEASAENGGKRRRLKKPKKEKKPKKQKKKRRFTLKIYVWLYFMFFVVFILVILWLFQYFFLPQYYRSAKIRDVKNTADNIIESYNDDDINGYVRHLAFDNNMYILVIDEDGNDVIQENNMGNFSFFSEDKQSNFGKTLYQFRSQLDDEDEDYITKIIKSKDFNSEEIFYCTRFTDDEDQELYLFIESPIEPIDSTTTIIREQLIYITIILFELAFIVTILISRRISRPIEKLTETAQKFGEGDYEVEFKAEGYKEIEELSIVLDDARNEVKKVSDLKKDLIANVSHDLRTPLTMVKAYGEMIRDLSGNDPIKREKHCQIIIDEADRLSGLVNSILELSKFESDNQELHLSDYSINDQIKDVMMRYTLLIEENGYDIVYEPDEDRIITADHDRLAQVIYNFINNAINYSGEEKHIRVKQTNKADVVRIEVIDNGVGIAKDKLSEVFDRYYRGGKVKRETVGTGLGLSICKEILKLHEFAFGVMSEEGKGSTFWFEANIAKKKPQELPAKPDDDEIIEAEFD